MVKPQWMLMVLASALCIFSSWTLLREFNNDSSEFDGDNDAPILAQTHDTIAVQEDLDDKEDEHFNPHLTKNYYDDLSPVTFSPQAQKIGKIDPVAPIPIVIISALRADYLELVLGAIQPSNQNPNTPDWLLKSKRYVFAHKNNNTDYDNRWNETQQVVHNHNCDLRVFEGLTTGQYPPSKPLRAYYTKLTWYRMMDYLFHTMNETEVLILEDDAVLAHDGLLMASALFQEKWSRQRSQSNIIKSIALGGAAGRNKVNADPNKIMAVRNRYFTAMAYSMDVTVFDEIHTNFQLQQASLRNATQGTIDRRQNRVEYADWTMEIKLRHFLKDIVQLSPSVGRMHHIGINGMGFDGNGLKHKYFEMPYAHWNNTTIIDDSRTLDDIRLDPPEITDPNGYVCNTSTPMLPGCWGFPNVKDDFGPNRVRMPTTHREMAALHEQKRLDRAEWKRRKREEQANATLPPKDDKAA